MSSRKTIQEISLFVAVFFLMNAYSQETESLHYRTSRYIDQKVVCVEHFRFDHSTLSLEAPTDWIPRYFVNDAFVRFQHRTVPDCMLEARKIPLTLSPTNETDALVLYESEVKKLRPPIFIKDARVRGIKDLSTFPQTYLLSVSTNDPPIRMTTFFMQPPYLYSIQLDMQSVLVGSIRKDYESVLQSLAITTTTTTTLPHVTNPSSMPAAETNQVVTTTSTNQIVETTPPKRSIIEIKYE